MVLFWKMISLSNRQIYLIIPSYIWHYLKKQPKYYHIYHANKQDNFPQYLFQRQNVLLWVYWFIASNNFGKKIHHKYHSIILSVGFLKINITTFSIILSVWESIIIKLWELNTYNMTTALWENVLHNMTLSSYFNFFCHHRKKSFGKQYLSSSGDTPL